MALSFNLRLNHSQREQPSPIRAAYQPSGIENGSEKDGIALTPRHLDNLDTTTLLDTCQLLADREPQLSQTLMDGLYRFYSLQTAPLASPLRQTRQGHTQPMGNTSVKIPLAPKSVVAAPAPKVIRIHSSKKHILKRQQVQHCHLHRFPALNPHLNPKSRSRTTVSHHLANTRVKQPLFYASSAPASAYLLPLHHLTDIIVALTHYGNSLLCRPPVATALEAVRLRHQRAKVKHLLNQWVSLADHVLASQGAQ